MYTRVRKRASNQTERTMGWDVGSRREREQRLGERASNTILILPSAYHSQRLLDLSLPRSSIYLLFSHIAPGPGTHPPSPPTHDSPSPRTNVPATEGDDLVPSSSKIFSSAEDAGVRRRPRASGRNISIGQKESGGRVSRGSALSAFRYNGRISEGAMDGRRGERAIFGPRYCHDCRGINQYKQRGRGMPSSEGGRPIGS